MGRNKRLIAGLIFILLPIFTLAGCFGKKKPVEYTVSVKQSEFTENIAFTIKNSEGLSIVNDKGLDSYEKGEQVLIELLLSVENDIYMKFNETLLNNYVVANSKAYSNLTESEYLRLKEEVEVKVTELMNKGKTREEAQMQVSKLKEYEIYNPSTITWTRESNLKYTGKITLTKDTVFEVLGKIYENDLWHVDIISDSTNMFSYTVNDMNLNELARGGLISSEANNTSAFSVIGPYFNLFILENPSATNVPIVSKIYYTYTTEKISEITADAIKLNENMFEVSQLHLHQGKDDNPNYYNVHISNVEQSDERFTDQHRHIAIFIEIEK